MGKVFALQRDSLDRFPSIHNALTAKNVFFFQLSPFDIALKCNNFVSEDRPLRYLARMFFFFFFTIVSPANINSQIHPKGEAGIIGPPSACARADWLQLWLPWQ
ncbi:hypothetical protein GOODEAATRI_020932 [Goodea atripinnis]|uniref:Uncharacterized protein n=1 Tax=Goodea atripinnis TaxID=208336 RepID=A0ABV0NLY9_9TELE